MRIQHNITALNAHRNLTNNNSSVGKNLEKLSSGYRINRAGDDAAGLAISEKMRAQITGLEQAQKNAEDGVSLVQTAEGALTEVHSMLNRMVALATQSANGTYSQSNRAEMQKEIDALREEIDRISSTANFNGTKLFTKEADDAPVTDIAGTLGGNAIAAGTDVAATKDQFKTGAIAYGGTDGEVTATINYTGKDGTAATATVKFNSDTDASTTATAFKTALGNNAELSALFDIAGNETGITLTAKTEGAGQGAVTGVAFDAAAAANATIVAGNTETAGADATKSFDLSGTPQAGDKVTIDGKEYTYDANADGTDGATFKDLDTLKVAAEKNGVTLNVVNDRAVIATKTVIADDPDAPGDAVSIDLHVGESSEDTNTIKVTIQAMSSTSLGVGKDAMNIKDAASAKAAINLINNAIDSVSSIRSDLGALQNRLEHTINNLGVQTENITAAESRIRDVDMAKEMMAYTKNNILVQASQAMLAQANTVPQGVLQLLQ